MTSEDWTIGAIKQYMDSHFTHLHNRLDKLEETQIEIKTSVDMAAGQQIGRSSMHSAGVSVLAAMATAGMLLWDIFHPKG